MKFYVYTNKATDETLNEVSFVVQKLYPNADVDLGKGKPSKYKQDRLDEEKAVILKADEVLAKTRQSTAKNIIEVSGIGVSDKVLLGL